MSDDEKTPTDEPIIKPVRCLSLSTLDSVSSFLERLVNCRDKDLLDLPLEWKVTDRLIERAKNEPEGSFRCSFSTDDNDPIVYCDRCGVIVHESKQRSAFTSFSLRTIIFVQVVTTPTLSMRNRRILHLLQSTGSVLHA